MTITSGETQGVDPAQQPNLSPKKDVWDKLSAISVFVSGVVLAAIGGMFTYFHQESESQRNINLKRHENTLADVATFEKFVPYLKGSPQDLGIAVLGISSLDEELGGKLLGHLAIYGTPEQKKFAEDLIEERTVQFFNNWNLDTVTQDQARFPAYLKGTAAQKQCMSFVGRDGVRYLRPAIFITTQPYFIRAIKNYHWNNGCGSDGMRLTTDGPAGELPATIALRDNQGLVYGPWKVNFVKQPSYGVEIISDWIAKPNIIIPANTYEIVDSDTNTWSYNQKSDNVGFSSVQGFSLK